MVKATRCCLVACLVASPCYGYRPFNVTDAAVAKAHEIELECGPVGYVADSEGHFLVAPSAILNLGIADQWEVVLEGRHFLLLKDNADRRQTLRDVALSVKHVVRSGTLQDRNGPSAGLEVGLLLPGIGIDAGVGAFFSGLVSQRRSAVTMHANASLEITHDHHVAGLAGTILEGPSRWVARPAAELTIEQNEGRTISGLVGAMWSVRENLSLDAGWLMARKPGDSHREFRAGFTWTAPLGHDPQSRLAAGSFGPPSLSIEGDRR